MTATPEWESVSSQGDGSYTVRLVVPGGWIYQIVDVWPQDDSTTTSTVFVPRPKESAE